MITKAFSSKICQTALSSFKIRPITPYYNNFVNPTSLMFVPSQLTLRPLYTFSEKDNKKQPKQQKKDKEQKQQKQREQNKGEQKQKESLQDRIKRQIDNFWQKPDPANPNKPPPSKLVQLLKKFELLVQFLLNKLKDFYFRKFKVSNILSIVLIGYMVYKYLSYQRQISPQAFIQLLKMHSFQSVQFVEQEYFRNNEIVRRKITGKLKGQQYYCEVISFDQILKDVIADGNIPFKNVRRSGFQTALKKIYIVLDTILLLFILRTITKASQGGMGAPQMGPQPKKFQMIKNVNIKFADVAGLHQSKREVQEVVDFLKNPAKYHALGATIPKGVLLTGPPGTGKTMLAKACAGQAGVPFFSVSGSDFVQVFVGVGASRVRQLFHQAKEQAPAIIFVDQLDAVGKKRQNKMGSNDQRESTLNQLLVQMDGFGTNSKVIVMGATNRKQILDNALVRPGRFDRQVQVGLPDLKGRFQILLVHLRPLKLDPKYTSEQYAKRIAALTPGFSGAQLANLCNQAAILAARCSKEIVQMLDFQLASQRVIGGVQRKGFVSLRQKKVVSYHESGHAVVSWFLQGADPLLKVSIIPRSKGALGFAQYFLNENQLQTKQELLDRICFILGGRCAELHFFNQVTTGAYDDLQKAYNIAYHLVAKFGMDQSIGYIAFPDPQYTKPFGAKVQAAIDKKIKQIIANCTKRTKDLVKKHQNDIKRLAQELLVKQTMDVRSIRKILGDRPFPINKTFQAYLQTEQTL